MNSPPRPEDASHATGGVLRGNECYWQCLSICWSYPGVEATSVISIKKAAVCLYTTSADPTIAHAGGVEELGFVKAKILMNIYLHSVLQSLATLDSSIKSKLWSLLIFIMFSHIVQMRNYTFWTLIITLGSWRVALSTSWMMRMKRFVMNFLINNQLSIYWGLVFLIFNITI